MSELKRTQLYDIHVAAGAELVDFGGWEMPIQYPSGLIAEHLYTRQVCSPERKAFLQHVLSSNVSALDLNMAQYCIIPNENGGAVDDAYLYLFEEDSYLLVVNAANTDKDLAHLYEALKGFDCQIDADPDGRRRTADRAHEERAGHRLTGGPHRPRGQDRLHRRAAGL